MKPVKAVARSVELCKGMNQLLERIIPFFTFHFISPLFQLLPTVSEHFRKCTNAMSPV